jgi:hypothetical protein
MALFRSLRQYLGVRAILPPDLQIATRAPTSADKAYVKGTLWLDTVAADAYMWPGSGNWISLGTTSSGDITSLTGSSGGAITPVAGNITIAAGTGMLSTVGTAGTITLNVNFAAPPALGSGTPAAVSATTLAATSGISVTGGDIINSHSNAGTDVTIEVTNSDNTNGASRSGLEIATGGASSGDPYLTFEISGVAASTMTMGLDNSASDLFVISNNSSLGTSNALTLSQAGALTATTTLTATLGDITATNGNLVLVAAGNKMMRTSVASTIAAGANSIGTVTLVGGTATISTTNITASSIIKTWRESIGATGAAAVGNVTIGTRSTGVSFVINAVSDADATVLVATDVSVIGWEIIN